MAATSNKLQYVQVLRGFAALFVLLFHGSLNSIEYFHTKPLLASIWNYGFTGVEFFFVLSGFIITYIHMKDLASGSGWKRFLRKRFTRIYPIYWVVATVMLCYYLFIKMEGQGISVKITGPADLLYLLQCYLLFPMDASHKNFINVAWTLSYEIWFYLVFAGCIVMGFRKSIWLYFTWGALILLKCYTHIGDASPALNFILNPMILYFLTGCFVAWLIKQDRIKLNPTLFLLLPAVFSLLLWIYAAFTGSVLDELRRDLNYYYIFMGLFGSLLWAAASLDLQSKSTTPSRWLLLMGDASYSIYLIHPAVIMLCYKIAAWGTHQFSIDVSYVTANIVFAITVLLSLLTGIALHLLIEKPLLSFLNGDKSPPFTWKPAKEKPLGV